MAYEGQSQLANDADFVKRIAAKATAMAVEIASESSAGLNPHRKALAKRVLKDALQEAEGLAWVVVRHAAIAAKIPPVTSADVTDAEIDAALSDPIWDGYAEAF